MFKKSLFLFLSLILTYSYSSEQKIELGFSINSIFCDNADLRKIDETSYKTVQHTDDFFYLLYANINLNYLFKNNIFSLYTKITKPFFFGNDDATKNSQPLSIENIFVDISIIKDLTLRTGRYKFRTFEDETIPDYVYSDTIDSLSLLYTTDFIKLIALVDFFGLNSPNYAYDVKINKEKNIQYFNGNVNIIKSGLLTSLNTRFENDWISLLSITPYLFYSSIGAVNSELNKIGGNEKTLKGTLGNFADGDYLISGGINSYISSSFYRVGIQFAYSYGKDFKNPYTPDVEISGFLISSYLKLLWQNFYLDLLSLYSEGGTLDQNGNWQNYGFVSMKGDKIGGYIFQNIYGIYPSGIVDYDGINFLPFERSRRAPMISLKAGIGIDKIRIINFDTNTLFFNLYLDSWFHFDNNFSKIDFSSIDSTSFEHFKRLSKFMGIENDLRISIQIDNQLELSTFGGILWSYDFFWKYPLTSDSPLGTDLSWIIGTELKIKI